MLELTDVQKSYAGFEFGPVDLTVSEEVLAVLGPSGSGKTTLLSLVAGLVAPDAGRIDLHGRRLDGRPVEDRRAGLVFQDGALFPHMTAGENIGYAATDDDRVDELAGRLEIRGVLDRLPAKLSGGEAQRVALARTLAADPDALLLDEPLSSLDAPIRRRLRDELHDLFGSLDIPVVYVTHDQRTATALGDRLAIVRDGALEQCGTPETVLRRPATRFVARFTGTENVLDVSVTGRNGETATLASGDLEFRATATVPVGASVTACIRPARLQLHAPDTASGATTVSGTVERWLNEGAEYRVQVTVGDQRLVATVQPPTFERLAAEAGADVRVTIPPDAVHLLS